MMRFLAAYVVKGRMQALLVAVVPALLSLFLPPLSYLSGAAVALVTLRMGVQQGLMLILGAVVTVGLFGQLLMQNPMGGMAFALGLWLPVWGLALSLRRTASQERSLVLATLFGVMAIAAFHLGTEDPVQWWSGLLQEALQGSLEQLGEAERAQLTANLQVIASLMTGGAAAALSASLIGSLLLGRWWQAMLYNPGGFGEEFRTIRLGQARSLLALLLLGAVLLIGGGQLFQDLFTVMLVPFVIQGIAVVHALVRSRGAHNGWLIALYVLLLLPPTTGHMALLLAFAGAVDNWFDFRTYFGPKGGAGNE